MTQIEKVTDQGTSRNDGCQYQPVISVVVSHSVVIADHDEQHRQREIVIVYATLFGFLAVNRIRRFTDTHGFHQFALPGNNHHQHVTHHHGADHGANVD